MQELDAFPEPYFRQAIQQHIQAYRAYLGSRLLAVYVWGSVHRNEAVAEVSDLDLHAFISDSFSLHERQTLEQQFPRLAWLTPPLPIRLLQQGLPPDADETSRTRTQALYVRLRYDATLVWGASLLTARDDLEPNRTFARLSFASVRDCLRYAVGLDKQNKSDFTLPTEAALRLRKLARLAVLGGGYLLMARGDFRSFQGTDVLPALRCDLPQWSPFLETTERLYIMPANSAVQEVRDYEQRMLAWVDWLHKELEE
jgi:predicted nucleotidyltransferase